MNKNWLLFSITLIALSCKGPKQDEAKKAMSAPPVNKAVAKYELSQVDNKIDLSCGMPLTAGIEDTCHYMGKIYGFCSKECKDDFLKNPAGAIKEK